MSSIVLVGAYARVSSEEQRRNETIQTQIDALRQHAERYGLEIAAWYLDDGVRGALELQERPGGARLLADAAAGKVGRVLVYRVDRLGRGDDPRVTLNAVYDLRDRGARVVSITEPFDVAEPAGAFMLSMLAGASSYERASILQRSRDGTNRLAKSGTWLGGIVPYGYKVEGRHREARLDPSEPEAEVIRLIYRLTVDEHYSCHQIADWLNANNIPTAYQRDGRGVRGKATAGLWRHSRIRNLIVSTTYMGIHHYGKRAPRERELITREVPALVDAETWERAQSVLREHLLFPPQAKRRAYLLRGLVRCGTCGLTYSGMTSVRRDGIREDRYYVCNGRAQWRGIYGALGKRCPGPRVRADKLEAAVWAGIEEWAQSGAGPYDQLSPQEQTEAIGAYLSEAVNLSRLAAGKQGEREAILDLYRRGTIGAGEVERQLDKIRDEATALESRAAELRRRASDKRAESEALSQAGDLLGQVRDAVSGPLDSPTKRALVELLVEGITVETNGSARVFYRFRAPVVVGG